MSTIRVDYERINGRYTNAEYRGKITRCDLTLNIKYRPVRRGGRGTPLAGLIFQKSAYGPEIISSFKIWTRVLSLKGHSMFKS